MPRVLRECSLPQGDLPGAAEQFQKAVKLEPSDPYAYCGLGSVFEKQGNYDAAVAEYRVALQLDADFVPAHRGLGKVFLARKDFANATSSSGWKRSSRAGGECTIFWPRR